MDRKLGQVRFEGNNIMPLEVDIKTPLEIRNVRIRRTPRDFAYEVLNSDDVVKRVKAMPKAEQRKLLDKIAKLDSENMTELYNIWDNDKELVSVLQDMGFDGIKTQESGSVTYGAFKPTQLKSKFNVGSYDTSTANILRAGIAVGAGLTAEQQLNKEI